MCPPLIVDAIKAEFLGAQAQPAAAESRVGVDVNVGLSKELEQVEQATVSGEGMRRANVGPN